VREPQDVPVARITFTDVLGEQMTLDLEPVVALRLANQLIEFVVQVGLDA
jgi:hypothetical protein